MECAPLNPSDPHEIQGLIAETETNLIPTVEEISPVLEKTVSINDFEPFLLNLFPDNDHENSESASLQFESQIILGEDLRSQKRKDKSRRKERRRKEKKKMLKGGQKMKRIMNHFVAIQITNFKIKEQVQEVQNKILSSTLPVGFNSKSNKDFVEEDSAVVFKDTMERLESLHFTMGVIGTSAKEEIERAQQAVESCWKKHKCLLENDPINLNILGLGHFGNKVIFAKIQNDEHISRLKALADDLRLEFDNSNIFQASNPFQPHMTIAKMSKSKTLYKKKIKSFPREIWNDYELHYFGEQPLESLQLLAMTRDPKTNYYKMIADYKLGLKGAVIANENGSSEKPAEPL
ncbi:unnamed protein product [Allacma fusca]|uniref:A-kinase anchor protein 7-like phosphoesterase domain-containing protein n=1 Tax=Allacma fusca TaxID=39272 RepID=A0A8J2LME0_9HEXA|nr:unnamed protein product [Allacma fusca]